MSNAFRSTNQRVSNDERAFFEAADLEISRVESMGHESNRFNQISGRARDRTGKLRFGSLRHILVLSFFIAAAASICCMFAIPSQFSWPLSFPESSNVQPTAKPVRDFPIEIIGREFKWNFRYPGPDGKLRTDDDHVTDNNRLFLPTHCTVRVSLKSEDYVYIFNVAAKKLSPKKSNAGDCLDSDVCTQDIVESDADFMVTQSKQYFLSAQSKTKQQGAAIPKHPGKMVLRSMDEDRIQLLINPGCGFRLIHDPEMGKIFVTDDYDYSRLLPAAESAE